MLQYQPIHYQICPSAYGVDATSIRIGKSLVGGGGDNRKVPLTGTGFVENAVMLCHNVALKPVGQEK